jgi:hypothetical protein
MLPLGEDDLSLDKAILQIFKPLKMVYPSLVTVSLSNSKRKTGGPPVYHDGLFEPSIDPS